MNPEKRALLPNIAFTSFNSRYKPPTLEEGFKDITEVKFQVCLSPPFPSTPSRSPFTSLFPAPFPLPFPLPLPFPFPQPSIPVPQVLVPDRGKRERRP